MKRAIIATALLTVVMSSYAVTAEDGVKVGDVRTERHGNYLSVDMNLGLSELDVKSNRAVLLTPSLVNGSDSLTMPSVAVYGRRRYFHYLRNEGETMLSGADEITLRARKAPEELAYHELVPYAEWLDGATLVLDRRDYGCCRTLLGHESDELARYIDEKAPVRKEFFPQLVYVKPEAQIEKRRVLEGRSYVDFPVDQTIIYPDYRRNAIELGVIRATIDTVRNDPDAKIDTVWLKGFASPESPYSHNTDLAKGRTEALRRYINNLYHFEGVAMLTDYEPEDWEGLRGYVVESNLAHRAEILALIDADIEPDRKEWLIKSRYPEDYRFMLDTWYPALRHTDYRVSYTVRSYSDPAEILRIMRERPQKLDQNEFYVAASTLEPGSDEFTEVFETAVRMFPEDEIANLNAANAALRRGDLAGAERYAAKAGTSPEADYARAAIAIHREDYDTARALLARAAEGGVAQATATLEELEEGLKQK